MAFREQTYNLRNEKVLANAIAFLRNVPLNEDKPLEMVVREPRKKRKLTLNAAMWAGPLADIERMAWHEGRQFRAEVWHEHLKELFLPDTSDPEFDPSEAMEGYEKWAVNPWTGNRVLVGSTTQLTDKGMRIYLLKMESYAAETYGVVFTEKETR